MSEMRDSPSSVAAIVTPKLAGELLGRSTERAGRRAPIIAAALGVRFDTEFRCEISGEDHGNLIVSIDLEDMPLEAEIRDFVGAITDRAGEPMFDRCTIGFVRARTA